LLYSAHTHEHVYQMAIVTAQTALIVVAAKDHATVLVVGAGWHVTSASSTTAADSVHGTATVMSKEIAS
jgi:hypothetical protein